MTWCNAFSSKMHELGGYFFKNQIYRLTSKTEIQKLEYFGNRKHICQYTLLFQIDFTPTCQAKKAEKGVSINYSQTCALMMSKFLRFYSVYISLFFTKYIPVDAVFCRALVSTFLAAFGCCSARLYVDPSSA